MLTLQEKDESKMKEEGEEKKEETILEKFASKDHKLDFDASRLPKWLYKYLVFRFNLLDRTGKSENSTTHSNKWHYSGPTWYCLES